MIAECQILPHQEQAISLPLPEIEALDARLNDLGSGTSFSLSLG